MSINEESTIEGLDNYSHENLHCSFCEKMNEDILRLVLIGQLSISLIPIIIKNKKISIEPMVNVAYYNFSHEKNFYELFDKPLAIDESHRQVPTLQEKFFTEFVSRLANYLKVDVSFVKESIINILTTSYEVVIDFNILRLTSVSQQRCNQISDAIQYIFWHPAKLSENKAKGTNYCWFDYVDEGCVVPYYSSPNIEFYVIVKDYFNCIHIIETKKQLIAWHFVDRSNFLEYYLAYSKKSKKQKKNTKNNLIPLDSNEFNYQYHVIHIFCCKFNGKDNAQKKCLFDHQEVIDSTKNSYIKLQSPVILETFNQEFSRRVFHVACEANIKSVDIYALLMHLNCLLTRTEIGEIAIQICGSLNSRVIIKMLKYVIDRSNVKMFLLK